MSFLSTASMRVTDVKEFLDKITGSRGIKYTAEKNSKHYIYVPYVTGVVVKDDGQQVQQNQVVAINGKFHEWTTPDGRYHSAFCIKDITRHSENDESVLLNDGTCPFCDRIQDAWDIYNYRMEKEERECSLVGDDRTKHLDKFRKTALSEMKVKDSRQYLYLLVVQFRVVNDKPVIDGDGYPEYDLKVMRMSQTRLQKIQDQLKNSGVEFAGSEFIIQYPDIDDKVNLGSQNTISPIFDKARITVQYPAIVERINKDVAAFDFDSITEAFPEWKGISTIEAQKITNEAYKDWDKYKDEL